VNSGSRAQKHTYMSGPYLDTLSSGSQSNFQKHALYKKLLVQPVPVPDLTHLGISTSLNGGGPEHESANRYANFDGRVTNTLRNIVRRVPGAIREDYRKADREAKEQRYFKQQIKVRNRRRRRRRPPSIESINSSEASRLEREWDDDLDPVGGALEYSDNEHRNEHEEEEDTISSHQ
jgi:hypothetical protein